MAGVQGSLYTRIRRNINQFTCRQEGQLRRSPATRTHFLPAVLPAKFPICLRKLMVAKLVLELEQELQRQVQPAVFWICNLTVADSQGNTPFYVYFGLAILGGFILNFMPCVLLVIAIKIISLMEQVNDDPGRVRLQGLMFAAGFSLPFWFSAVWYWRLARPVKLWAGDSRCNTLLCYCNGDDYFGFCSQSLLAYSM